MPNDFVLDVDSDLRNADWPKRTPDRLSDLEPTENVHDVSKQKRDKAGQWVKEGSAEWFKQFRLKDHAYDTQAAFKYPNSNHYVDERYALHQAIKDAILSESTPVDNPVALMLGGGTASGKSTLRESGNIEVPENSSTVDLDEIREYLPEYQDGLARKLASASTYVHNECRDIGASVAKSVCSSSRNLISDGTGDGGYDGLKGRVTNIRNAGLKVVAHYSTLPVAEAIKRSDKRAEETGRYVPHHIIRDNHQSVSTVLPRAVKEHLFDEVHLWDNRGKKPVHVMSQVGGKTEIHNQDLWDEFLAKAHPDQGAHYAH